MKKSIILLACFAFGISNSGFSQTVIQGTITDPSPGGNKVSVYGKNNSSTALSNVLFGNINITFSIVDQTSMGGNPTEAQIVKASMIPSLDLLPTDGNNPYIIAGRAYYSYLMNNIATATTTSTWLANSKDNPIAEFTFPTNTYFSTLRLDDQSPAGGPNGQMYWYVQVNGAGDITDYANMFFGSALLPPTNNNSASPSFVPLQPFSVVPVKFLNFTAIKNNNQAILNWSVENEDANVDRYEVERSLSAVDFVKVGTLSPKNNGRAANSYSFTQDNLSAIRAVGVIYFRIKQIDKDGKFVYTEIKSVRLDAKGLVIGVYPNPVKGIANVSFDLIEDADVVISISDVSGKQLMANQIQGFKGPNISKINMAKLAAGSYLLKIQAGEKQYVLPVVKTN